MVINYLVIGVLWALILEWINNISIKNIEDISLDVKDRGDYHINLAYFLNYIYCTFNKKL